MKWLTCGRRLIAHRPDGTINNVQRHRAGGSAIATRVSARGVHRAQVGHNAAGRGWVGNAWPGETRLRFIIVAHAETIGWARREAQERRPIGEGHHQAGLTVGVTHPQRRLRRHRAIGADPDGEAVGDAALVVEIVDLFLMMHPLAVSTMRDVSSRLMAGIAETKAPEAAWVSGRM